MSSTFNPQILVDKLSKLNNSQQSIETLSHWCIFHMNKAKPVVETWARQFHCSPREQRLAFLYLANDILQNSRRKGSEFVGEFWKVLPDALRDVIDCGGEFGRNAAIRLIRIWEDRKVFGSRGQILKEELLGRHDENTNRNDKLVGNKLKHCGNTVDKLVSDYQAIYGGPLDEDAILSKCRVAIGFVEKMDKEIARDTYSEQLHGSGFVEEFQGQYGILKDCIEQLIAVESSRASLVSDLRVALQEQESKLDHVRSQLQAAQAHSDQACNMCQHVLNTNNVQLPNERSFKNPPPSTSKPPQTFHVSSNNGDQSAPVMYTRNLPEHSEEEHQKSAAAAVAAKLTASTSSAQMLTFVLSSLASEGLIGNPVQPPSTSGNFQSEKRLKLENEQTNNSSPFLLPLQNPQIPYPNIGCDLPFPPPLPLSVPPLQPPMPPYNGSFAMGYPENGGMHPPPPQMNPYLNFQRPEGVLYSQHSSLPMVPISRQ